MLSKTQARKVAMERRKNLALDERKLKDEKISKLFLSLDEVKSAKKVCVYLNIGSEVSSNEIILELQKQGKELFAPKTCGDDMFALGFEDLSKCIKGNFNIPEPDGEKIEQSELDLIIVPLVGYSADKARIGYGKGYYDRFLPEGVLTVGLAYVEQYVDFLPETFDKTLDIIVTDKGVIR